MLKKWLLLLVIFVFNMAFCLAYEPYLPKGTLVKVQVKTPYSTANLEEGSRVYFIAPADVWVLEKRMVAKGDIFEGVVSMLKMPVQGINAAMKIEIYNILKKDGSKIPCYGKIIFSSKDVLGGNLTNPLSYNTSIHPKRAYGNRWGGTLQYVPSGEYEFGQHMTIGFRDSLFVEVMEDFYN